MEEEKDFCRICLDSNDSNNFINPCKCSGTSKHVHDYCLITWINQNRDNQKSKICDQCKHPYVFKKQSKFINCTSYICEISFKYFTLGCCLNLFILSFFYLFNYLTNITELYSKFFFNINFWLTGSITFYIFLIFYLSIIKILINCEYLENNEDLKKNLITNTIFTSIFAILMNPVFPVLTAILSLYVVYFFRKITYQIFLSNFNKLTILNYTNEN